MYYTIAVLEDLAQETRILFNACGNKYQVQMILNEFHVETKTYDTHAEAVAVFMKLADAVVTGCYSHTQRVAML